MCQAVVAGMVIFTTEYLDSAPHADLEVTFPDGAVLKTRALSDGNGMLVANVRDAIAFERASRVVECSRHFDRIRKSHLEALARDPNRASSQWTVSK